MANNEYPNAYELKKFGSLVDSNANSYLEQAFNAIDFINVQSEYAASKKFKFKVTNEDLVGEFGLFGYFLNMNPEDVTVEFSQYNSSNNSNLILVSNDTFSCQFNNRGLVKRKFAEKIEDLFGIHGHSIIFEECFGDSFQSMNSLT